MGTSAPTPVQISFRSHVSLIALLSRHKRSCCHLSQFPKGLYPGAPRTKIFGHTTNVCRSHFWILLSLLPTFLCFLWP